MRGTSARLRSTLNRWASTATTDDRELQDTTIKAGCCPIAQATDRQQVSVQGVLRTVTLRPRGGVPALEAELYDGSATILVVWLGRRRIGGIEPGRSVRVSGRISRQEGQPLIFNPRYELLAA